jgi:hypothetical protein
MYPRLLVVFVWYLKKKNISRSIAASHAETYLKVIIVVIVVVVVVVVTRMRFSHITRYKISFTFHMLPAFWEP